MTGHFGRDDLKRILENVLKGAPADRHAELVVVTLEKYDGLARERKQIWAARESARHAYEQELQALGKREEALKQACDHPLWKRHQDPAGGSDSWSECKVCGKERV